MPSLPLQTFNGGLKFWVVIIGWSSNAVGTLGFVGFQKPTQMVLVLVLASSKLYVMEFDPDQEMCLKFEYELEMEHGFVLSMDSVLNSF